VSRWTPCKRREFIRISRARTSHVRVICAGEGREKSELEIIVADNAASRRLARPVVALPGTAAGERYHLGERSCIDGPYVRPLHRNV